MRIFLVLIPLSLFSCSDRTDENLELVKDFYEGFNSKDYNQLNEILDEDFKYYTNSKDTLYTGKTILDKEGFLAYTSIPTQSIKLVYTVINTSNDQIIVHSKANSDLSNYLEFSNPEKKETFFLKHNKIFEVQADTVEGYLKKQEIKINTLLAYFEWLNQKYPNVSIDELEENPEMALRYLKEYKGE